MAELIKTSAIKRAGPSIVGIDIDGDRGAWKIHIVQAGSAERYVCFVRSTLSDFVKISHQRKPVPEKCRLQYVNWLEVAIYLAIRSQNQSWKLRVRDVDGWDYHNSRNSVGLLPYPLSKHLVGGLIILQCSFSNRQIYTTLLTKYFTRLRLGI